MTRVEERRGFAIFLETPPAMKSLWAALVRIDDPNLVEALEHNAKVCLACSREAALAEARAFIDEITARRG